ncbi:IS3 family transposase [Yimella lutea]|uniref:Transposase InsO family protein n=1 Tax=Yimella lutea TaxID=587872 RepID=A0A542EFB4_9MICO|nr:IS3 family transposase [Yimella lutea]TQJ14032.1 transposase InsO family protein [Yimella lutea]TQJ15134.1 transposase InsO family protein [Yimella lutea]
MSIVQGCAWLGIARSSYYRYLNPPPRIGVVVPHTERAYPNRVTAAEAKAVVQALNTVELAGLSIRQAHFELLDQGVYLCSLPSMHRIMRREGQSSDRRRHTAHRGYGARSTPRLHATAPGQVWCWDITNLPGPGRMSFKLYSMIDLYSRYVVGYRVEHVEDHRFTQELFNNAFTAQQGTPQVIHADNGGVMRAGTVRELLATMHVHASYSRPRVSNDNAFAEALFKTVKYDLDYPEEFDSLEHARQWSAEFFDRYNTRHHHAGLAGHTPARVHHGTWSSTHDQWATTKAAYAAKHTARHHKPPITHMPPDTVWINKPNTPNPQLSQTA